MLMSWIIMTWPEKVAATLFDDEDVRLGAREVTNPLADSLGHGVLLGKWVAPARLLSDPEYVRWVPSLAALPAYEMDSEALFLPPVE